MMDRDAIPDGLTEALGANARALALLHVAMSDHTSSAHERFLQAAMAFEEALTMLDLPVSRLYLARSYSGAGRFQEALATLDQLKDDPPEAADEFARLSAEVRGRFVKSAVRHSLAGSPPTVGQLIDWNPAIIDDQLAADLHATAVHYADRSDPEIGDAIDTLLSALQAYTSNPLWEAIRLEATGIRDVSSRRSQRALEALYAAHAVYHELGISAYIASIANHLGLAHSDRGEFAEAAAAFNESIVLYRVLDLAMAGRVLENHAASMLKQHRVDEALAIAAEAVAILDQLDRPAQADKARLVVAHAMNEAGDWDEALSMIDEVLTRSRSSWAADDPDALISALTSRGYILESAGMIEDAERSLSEAATVRTTTKTAQGSTATVERFGIASRINFWDEAVQEELRALAAHEDAGNNFDVARNKLNLAKLFMNRMAALPFSGDEAESAGLRRADELVQALTLLREAIPVFARANTTHHLHDARQSLATLRWLFGDVEGAADSLRGVIVDAVNAGDFGIAGSASQNLARTCLELGRPDEARQAIAYGRQYAIRAKDATLVWHLDWIEAQLLRLVGNIDGAQSMYLSLVERHIENERKVGSAELVVGWSRDKTLIFDEAVEFFLLTNQAGPAYAIVLAAKARTLVSAITIRAARPQAGSASDVAHLLLDDASN
ncbi:tetratricopeptide repeat protein [Nakamurella sp.]|uniref:tetratricopeptide repeat protein n=1 Tax=Nakamurella sp. TaxID=1869182 RepID=UPI003B3A61E6